jgi:5-methylcytosine-specific restriction protein A
MALRDILQTILTDYREARSKPFAGNPLATLIRHEAAEAVKDALGEVGAGFLVEGSAGAGNWAAVLWISVFDPMITTSATQGYYVVYLFHAMEPTVHLSLNQGTTAVREEFGVRAREILQDRARSDAEAGRGFC